MNCLDTAVFSGDGRLRRLAGACTPPNTYGSSEPWYDDAADIRPAIPAEPASVGPPPKKRLAPDGHAGLGARVGDVRRRAGELGVGHGFLRAELLVVAADDVWLTS